MKKRPVRETTHAWSVLYTFAHLYFILNLGYEVLREKKLTAEATNRERVILYFVLHGIVESLAQVEEAINILAEIEPSLSDVRNPFEEDFALWRRFRDDAAHIADRTHRVSLPGQNDARIREDQYGYDADTLGYDYDTDTVYTGTAHSMPLRDAIEKAKAVMFHADQRIQDAASKGLIRPPPRFRDKGV